MSKGTGHGGKRPGAGRKMLGSSPLIRTAIALSKEDIAYLQTIHPKNLSAAIRQLIAQARSQ